MSYGRGRERVDFRKKNFVKILQMPFTVDGKNCRRSSLQTEKLYVVQVFGAVFVVTKSGILLKIWIYFGGIMLNFATPSFSE